MREAHLGFTLHDTPLTVIPPFAQFTKGEAGIDLATKIPGSVAAPQYIYCPAALFKYSALTVFFCRAIGINVG